MAHNTSTSPPRADAVSPSMPLIRKATRYLSAAAYLHPELRDRIIRELITNGHRAVAPSHGGFDVVPVLRHCLRARRMLSAREAAVSGVLLFGMIAAPAATISWLAFLMPFVLLTTQPMQRLSHRWRTLILSVLLFPLFIGAIISTATAMAYFVAEPTSAFSFGLGFFVVISTLGIVVASRLIVYNTLARMARPGSEIGLPPSASPEVEERLAWISRAQTGNLTLYSGEDPFLGAGTVRRAWNLAVELDRKKTSGGGAERSLVRIDPLEVYDFVRGRLAQMASEVNHQGEAINLEIGDHVVAPGRFNQLHGPGNNGPGLHPLVDPRNMRPFSELTQTTIEAIIRNPQAGARHYQRVTIGSIGPEVRDEHGVSIVPAEDRDAAVSAFIHLAVEGRMLFTQFIVTVLAPVAPEYRRVDELPMESTAALAKVALTELPLQLLRDIVAAPMRLARFAYQSAFGETRVQDDPRKYVVYDYGARCSVRQLGTPSNIDTFIEYLDAYKYTRLIEERLTAAVLDFLEERDIDTSAYRLQAASISQSGNIIYGGNFINANIAGQGAQFNQGSEAK
jgi:hypothetical protein